MTVLPVVAKVFEMLVHMQTTEYFEPLFHDFVSEYPKIHGCPSAVLTLAEHKKAERDKRIVIAVIAIDLSKAFDCLLRGLILKRTLSSWCDRKGC